MREIQCEQGQDLWLSLRRGRPTASKFGEFVTLVSGELSNSEGADKYAASLVAELLGWEEPFKGNYHTDRGHALEDSAFRWLKFRYGYKARKAGICLSECGRYAASPDGFLEDGTCLEIKVPALNTFLAWKMKGTLPNDHKRQVHAQLAVTGAHRAIFLAYADHEALENLVIEVFPDDYTKRVREAAVKFCDKLDKFRAEVLGDELDFYLPKTLESLTP